MSAAGNHGTLAERSVAQGNAGYERQASELQRRSPAVKSEKPVDIGP